ncbi:cardiolipin-specific deacylase 1, mitochondrial [Monosporozyma servazzii]
MSANTHRSTLLKIFTRIKSMKMKTYKSTKSANSLVYPTEPTAIPLWKIVMSLPSLFPRSIRESFSDYKTFHTDPESMEKELLSTLTYFPTPGDGKISKIIKTPIDNKGNFINEFCIMPEKMSCSEKDIKHMIFIHGYGAGMGFFLKNMERIILVENKWCVHFIDLPGFGFSSRDKFPFEFPKDDVKEVESWFHENIRLWFEKRNLLQHPQNNIVVAHSLGAYLMIMYKNAFPEHFKKLILCSPAGVCDAKPKKTVTKPPWWYVRLWEKNISPFSLVRNSGQLGSKLTSGWSYRRFKKITTLSQFEALHKYSYAIFNKRGSGEYLLAFILKCGGDPRLPIEKRITKKTCNWDPKSEWLWLYGENDWMNIAGGNKISQYINRNKLGRSKVMVVPDAGHHLYLDNYAYFNMVVQNEMKSF